ncbi:2-keto-4-pentenoate hydratase [Clostridium sporogenes]
MEDAYKIQEIGTALRVGEGKQIIGRKIGITSKGMQLQLNVTMTDYGCLLSNMRLREGESCKMSDLNLPRIEGEIAFVLERDLKGPDVTVADVYNSTAWIFPCLEVCDTRIENWDVTVLDTISDNAGDSKFVLGSAPKKLSEINLKLIGMLVEKNGVAIDSAAGAEVMGKPVEAVAWLANKLSEFDISLKAGDVILSGAFLSAIPAVAGDVFTLSLDGFPSLNLKFV